MREMDAECFAKAIEKEVASIEADRQRAREAREREQKDFDAACRTALRVRTEVILPLLNGLRDAFAKTRVLPQWEVATVGEADTFSAACRSRSAAPGELSFCIKADAAVQDNGAKLGLSVACECEDPAKAAESRTSELCKKETYIVNAVGFNMTDAHRWYYLELEKCALACLRRAGERAV